MPYCNPDAQQGTAICSYRWCSFQLTTADIDRVEVRQLKENFWRSSSSTVSSAMSSRHSAGPVANCADAGLAFSPLETSVPSAREPPDDRSLGSEMAFWRGKDLRCAFRGASPAGRFQHPEQSRGQNSVRRVALFVGLRRKAHRSGALEAQGFRKKAKASPSRFSLPSGLPRTVLR